MILAAQEEHRSKAIPSLLVFQPSSEQQHILKHCLWDQRLSSIVGALVYVRACVLGVTRDTPAL